MERKERIDENDPLNLVLDHAHTINREHAENISNMVKDLLQTVKDASTDAKVPRKCRFESGSVEVAFFEKFG